MQSDNPLPPGPPLRPAKDDQRFPSTKWTVLERAAGGGPDLEEFANLYYEPVYRFTLAIVRDVDRARELTQKFFLLKVLEGRVLSGADRSKGRFRAFLKQTVRNFLFDEARRIKPMLRPDVEEGGWDVVVSEGSPAHDKAYLRGWAEGVVHMAIEKVRIACEQRGQEQHFRIFAGRFLTPGADAPGWRELGRPFGLDEKTARSRADTVARHFRMVVREVLARETGTDAIDDEIRDLIALLDV